MQELSLIYIQIYITNHYKLLSIYNAQIMPDMIVICANTMTKFNGNQENYIFKTPGMFI